MQLTNNNEGVFMGPTQGPYILQLCMGPSYFWGGLTPPDPPLFRTLVGYLVIPSDTKDTKQCLHVKRLDPSYTVTQT